MLIGREVELGRLLRALETARGGGSDVLVVRGEAGMGKTALLEALIAAADGMTVLRARGVESESVLGRCGRGGRPAGDVAAAARTPAPGRHLRSIRRPLAAWCSELARASSWGASIPSATSTRASPSFSATRAACSGAAPPNAISV